MSEQTAKPERTEKVILITVEGSTDNLFSISLHTHPLVENCMFYDRLALRAKVELPCKISTYDDFDEETTPENIVLLDGIYKIIGIHQCDEDKYLPYLIETMKLSPDFFQNAVSRFHLIREFDLNSDIEALTTNVLFCQFTK